MPKLPDSVAKATAEAETGNSMEEGLYEVVLTAVVAEKNGVALVGKESGEPYWTWELTFPDDANLTDEGKARYAKRKLWRNISLGEKSAGMRKEAFDAFGVSTDTDTDELVERAARCLVQVKNVADTYNGGTGVKAEIRRMIPLETTQPVVATAKGKGKAADKDNF